MDRHPQTRVIHLEHALRTILAYASGASASPTAEMSRLMALNAIKEEAHGALRKGYWCGFDDDGRLVMKVREI